MAKTVINLVKELGAKTTAEVISLLREVGVDTEAEGFGVMTRIDDDFVAKLHAHRRGETIAKAPVTTSRQRQMASDATEKLDLKTPTRVKRKVTKDFFGTAKAEIEAPPKRAADEKKPKAKPEPSNAGAAAAKAKAQPATKAARPRSAKPAGRKDVKPDLSRGPRIISMPDPEEVNRLKARREAPRPGAQKDVRSAPPTSSPARKRGKIEKRKESDFSGRRRKLKTIGGRMDDERMRSRKRVFKVAGKAIEQPTVVRNLKITGDMSIRNIAKNTGIKVSGIVRFLMTDLGIMAGINYIANVDEIQLVCGNFEIEHSVDLDQAPEAELKQFEDVENLKEVERPPVVTVMGHVDHGKTKLLDAIRATNVVDAEAGGITQHIGAYQVEKKGKKITFLDTPGHAAFTAMRARGSQVTDIVILVVAADDGVMPQTLEAIDHARAADVPIIVAVNKIDKVDANPDKVMNQLAERELTPEAWGGDTIFVNTSALKGEGIDDILEMVLLTNELLDPKADPTAPPFGVIVESKVDTGIGVVATVLIQQGTMAKGQFLLSGTAVGRIKRMENDQGDEVDEALPSMPVQIIGFGEPPENGEKVYSFKHKKQAQAIADQRQGELRQKAAAGASSRMSLEAFFKKAEAGEIKDLNVIIKADVGGSAEALEDALKKVNVEGTVCQVISCGVGQINETDINLAAASKAVIIGFGIGISPTAKRIAERNHVDVRLYDIIYKITEDLELAMKGMLAPEFERKALGRVEIRVLYKQDKSGSVCGCYVLDGMVKRGAKYDTLRAGEKVLEAKTLNSLKRFKDDAKEVASGFECGLFVEDRNVEEGDILDLYEMVEIKRI